MIISVIAGELYMCYIKKTTFKNKESFQLTIFKEMCLWNILESCSEGLSNFKKTFAMFKKSHTSEHYVKECVIMSYTLGIANEEKAQDIAKIFYNLERKYHHGKNEDILICIRRNFGTNENTKLLFSLISQPPTKREFFRRLIPEAILNIFKTQYIAGVCFIVLVSAKLWAYYADVYKDIYVIAEYSKLLKLDNLNSFGVQVFILLIVSVTLPVILNLCTLHQANEWSNLKSRAIHFGILILFPFVPALAVYVSTKLKFLSQGIKTFHQTNEQQKSKNSSESIKKLLKNDQLMQQSPTLLSDLRSNENATEHFIQCFVLIMLIALKLTKSGSVSGFQELLAGNSNFILLVLSALWSVFSIISGFMQRKIIQKNHYMPFTGMGIQLSYASLAMICRFLACVNFFAPSIGLFNLLRHWKMGNLNFVTQNDLFLAHDVTENGTLVDIRAAWTQIKSYEELTVYKLDVYYIVFLSFILIHFCIATAIKLKSSKEFKSRKDYLKKILHIFHQGNSHKHIA